MDYQGQLTGKQIDQIPSDMAKLEASISEMRTQVDGFSDLIDEKYRQAKEDVEYEYTIRTTPIIQKLQEYRNRLAAL